MIPSEFNQDMAARRRRLQEIVEIDPEYVNKGEPDAPGTWFTDASDQRWAPGRYPEQVRFYDAVLYLRSNDPQLYRYKDIAGGIMLTVFKDEYIPEGKIEVAAANMKTGEVILRIPGSAAAPNKETTRLALLADRTPGAVFGPNKDRARGLAGQEEWSFKIARKDPVEVATFLRANFKDLFEEICESRSISDIAREIRKDWKPVNYAAVPYLSAMSGLDKITDTYGADSAKTVVSYFLGNAASWKGETAKRIKLELKALLKEGLLQEEKRNVNFAFRAQREMNAFLSWFRFSSKAHKAGAEIVFPTATHVWKEIDLGDKFGPMFRRGFEVIISMDPKDVEEPEFKYQLAHYMGFLNE